jgi:hypothetical protein
LAAFLAWWGADELGDLVMPVAEEHGQTGGFVGARHANEDPVNGLGPRHDAAAAYSPAGVPLLAGNCTR